VSQFDEKMAGAKMPPAIRDIIRFAFLYVKYLVLVIIPILALSGFIVFQRLNYNYAEHHIISGFVMLGSLVLIFAGMLIGKISEAANALLSFFGPLLFTILVYYQATKKKYTLTGFAWRMIPFFVLSFIWSCMFFVILVLFVSNF
ncbi:MAG TPA: hypothetical protein VEA37_13110, partial [Flavobacterium sp.]|nr:hypothetical protein [Flavobacterium sp.]